MSTDEATLRQHVRDLATELRQTVERLSSLRGLGDRAERAADELEKELLEQPFCIDRIVTYRVTLGTGGPATGVDFDQDGCGQAWYQDWYTPRSFVDLDPDTAEALADEWGVTAMMEAGEERDREARW